MQVKGVRECREYVAPTGSSWFLCPSRVIDAMGSIDRLTMYTLLS